MSAPAAYLVTSREGYRTVFLERARAEQYAVACHGSVLPLIIDPQTRPTGQPDHITDKHTKKDP